MGKCRLGENGESDAGVKEVSQEIVSGKCYGRRVDREAAADVGLKGESRVNTVLRFESDACMVRAVVTVGNVAVIPPDHN